MYKRILFLEFLQVVFNVSTSFFELLYQEHSFTSRITLTTIINAFACTPCWQKFFTNLNTNLRF